MSPVAEDNPDHRRSSLSRPRARIARLLLVVAVPLAILGVFFVLPVAGMIATGFWTDGTFDPVAVLTTSSAAAREGNAARSRPR